LTYLKLLVPKYLFELGSVFISNFNSVKQTLLRYLNSKCFPNIKHFCGIHESFRTCYTEYNLYYAELRNWLTSLLFFIYCCPLQKLWKISASIQSLLHVRWSNCQDGSFHGVQLEPISFSTFVCMTL
jgi:hypothetical protein